MSQIKLIQQIRELTIAMEQARERGDILSAEEIEDEIFMLQEELEGEDADEYQSKHQHKWN
jgi:hypothetical protein